MTSLNTTGHQQYRTIVYVMGFKPRVLVLGASGLLGSAVARKLQSQECSLAVTTRGGHAVQGVGVPPIQFDAVRHYFDALPTDFDWVVNCIGVVKRAFTHLDGFAPENTDAYRVNSVFPHRLSHWAEQTRTRVLHVSTDCVFSGRRPLTAGGYTELDGLDFDDEYGQSKALGEPVGGSCMTFRQTFVGIPPSLTCGHGLIAWLMRAVEGSGHIPGFIDHMWNGFTASALADVYWQIIAADAWIPGVHHLFSNDVVTKFDVLNEYLNAFQTLPPSSRLGKLGCASERLVRAHAADVGSRPENRTLGTVLRSRTTRGSSFVDDFDVPDLSKMVSEDVESVLHLYAE